jgi:predicted DNA repair protein MutK
MDDLGFQLIKRSNEKGFFNALGVFLVKALPIIIKILAVVGTIALILVAGGIFAHNVGFLHGILPNVPAIIVEALLGIAAGLIMFMLIEGGKYVFAAFKGKAGA